MRLLWIVAGTAYYSYVAWLLHAVWTYRLPRRITNNMLPLEVKK